MKLQEIIKKNDQELAEVLSGARNDLAKAIIDSRTKEIRDVKLLGRLKKTVARALTITREREITKQEQV